MDLLCSYFKKETCMQIAQDVFLQAPLVWLGFPLPSSHQRTKAGRERNLFDCKWFPRPLTSTTCHQAHWRVSTAILAALHTSVPHFLTRANCICKTAQGAGGGAVCGVHVPFFHSITLPGPGSLKQHRARLWPSRGMPWELWPLFLEHDVVRRSPRQTSSPRRPGTLVRKNSSTQDRSSPGTCIGIGAFDVIWDSILSPSSLNPFFFFTLFS